MKKNLVKTPVSPNDNSPNGLTPDEDNWPLVVAIGASAGGLESLKNFLLHSHPDPNLAFVILTHLSPDHVSVLPELLQKYTSIKVVPIKSQQKVKGNYIYVLPPGKKASINNGVLELEDQNRDSSVKLPIDFFLSSLALDQGRKAICIILSGMGQDGTKGLSLLREKGGLVIAQTVNSALFEIMPQSAINTGLVDYILPPEDMHGFLLKYAAHLRDKSIILEEGVFDEIQKILNLIKTQTGHDFSLYKSNTIFRRLKKRLIILHIHNLSQYLTYLHHHPAEISILFKELLINVTNFFRDPDAFDLLKKELIEKISLHNPEDNFRVWIPACATGEEVYSIAIIIHECMGLLNLNIDVQIFGTDIDEDAIEIARAGVFSTNIKDDISPERLNHYFTKENKTYKINVNIRKMIVFAVQNIIKDPPFTRLDLLSCRNLLIYLTAPLQKRVLPLFHYSLKPKGLLFLGSSETIGASAHFFLNLNKKWKIFARKEGASEFITSREVSFKSTVSETSDVKIMGNNMQNVETSLSDFIKNLLLKYCSPTSVVIDEKFMIVYINGHTGRFLEFPSGEVRLNFMDMLRPNLKSKISHKVNEAFKKQDELILNNLQFNEDGAVKFLKVSMRPITKMDFYKGKLLLILFEDAPKVSQEKQERKGSNETKTSLLLEEELKYTKENLQTTIEELETSNEELKSSNEELQSTNEELQSINEEVETSKEELQSLNEELSTVNAELENRIEQLSSANDDIKNLFDNTEIATIFLDKNLCIKRFTPKATEIINLIPSDVGRPISHIVSNLNYDRLVDDARNVLQTLTPITTEGIDKNGQWFVIRIIPYRTITNCVDGVVINFLNIHTQKQTELKLNELEADLSTVKEFNNTLLNAIASPALIVDVTGNIILANNKFIKQLNVDDEEVKGLSLYELRLDWDKAALKNLMNTLLTKENLVENYKIGGKTSITAHRFSSIILLIIN
jgi:two-component system CheB/CheR fusion protein